MEREVGGGIGMGNTCKPMAVSFQCMTKSTTNKKKIRFLYHFWSQSVTVFKKKKKPCKSTYQGMNSRNCCETTARKSGIFKAL